MSVKRITETTYLEVNEKDCGRTEGQTFDDIQFKASSWGYRHRQSLMLFCTLTIAYSMRACMGVALIAMTHHEIKLNGSEISNSEVNASVHKVEVENFSAFRFFNALMLCPPYPTFKWNKKVQDTVQSSFFWGYMLLQIPSGHLAHKFGPRRLLSGAMLINCAVFVLLPFAAFYGGWICTAIFRIALGLSQACIFPGIHTFFGKWAPIEERGRLAALTYGGQVLGPVLGLPITGFISATAMGWPGIFRFYGILSGVTGGVLWFLMADTPLKHPKISLAERKYIENSLSSSKGDEKRKIPVPWSQILRSPGMYAIITAHIGQTWTHIILYSEIPAFLKNIMGVSIETNGLLTALPYVTMWLANFFFCWFSDMLIAKKIFRVTNIRKMANTLGCLPTAFGFIIVSLVPKNIYLVEAIMVITCSFKVSTQSGFLVNHIDISPNFAGTMMSLSNFFANLVGSLAPIFAGFILTDVTDVYLWRQVFFVTAAIILFSNLIYAIFGTCELADWNDPDFNATKSKNHDKELSAMLKKTREITY